MFPRLIGMVHLGALPGAPGYREDFDSLVQSSIKDAEVLEAAGLMD